MESDQTRYRVNLTFLTGPSMWIDATGREHVRIIIRRAHELPDPPASITVLRDLDAAEMASLMPDEQQVGFRHTPGSSAEE